MVKGEQTIESLKDFTEKDDTSIQNQVNKRKDYDKILDESEQLIQTFKKLKSKDDSFDLRSKRSSLNLGETTPILTPSQQKYKDQILESYDRLNKTNQRKSKKQSTLNADEQLEPWEEAIRKRWMSVDLEIVKEYQNIKDKNISSLNYKEDLKKIKQA